MTYLIREVERTMKHFASLAVFLVVAARYSDAQLSVAEVDKLIQNRFGESYTAVTAATSGLEAYPF